MEVLTKNIAKEYQQRAERLPPNGLQDIGERRKLRIELQNRCTLSEVDAINTLNGYYVDMAIIASQRNIRRLEEKMKEVRVEKNGFTLYLGGTWMEISNKYGVLEHGDVAVDPEDITEEWAESKLEKFIGRHKVVDFPRPDIIKKVAFDPDTQGYIQLQAVYSESDEVWTVQKYDDEFVYMGEIWSGCKYQDEVKNWMHDNYQIESGLTAYVFRDSLGDCTNDGISSARKELYIMTKEKYPFEPEDLRQCVGIEFRDCCGEPYVDAKPLYFPRRWYMAGGNFLYTSDSRYKKITGISYPVSIHDRYEGR